MAEIQWAIGNTVIVTGAGTKAAESRIRFAQNTTAVFSGVKDAFAQVFLNNQQICGNMNQQAFAIQQVLAAMKSINLDSGETTAGIATVKDRIILLDRTVQELQKFF